LRLNELVVGSSRSKRHSPHPARPSIKQFYHLPTNRDGTAVNGARLAFEEGTEV
jgi:hypothetical protein